MRRFVPIILLIICFQSPGLGQYHNGNCSVYITSRPAGADILIDGIPSDRQTPAMIAGLAPGGHTILLEWGAYTAEKKISLEEGIFTRHELQLKLKPVKVLVESEPDSVLVILGDREIGYTPITAETGNPGSLKFRFKKEGYITRDTLIYYQERKEYNLPIILNRSGTLFVHSDPRNADVFVDQRHVGTTPFENEILAGEHGIQVMTGDYQAYYKAVEVPPGGKVEVFAVLEKLRGRLTIQGLPDSADVYLDGKFFRKTPIEGAILNVGEYDVSYSIPGYERPAQSYRAIVVQEMTAEVNIDARRKSALNAAWRSAVFPGWGQYYAERKNISYLYIAGELSLATATVASVILYNQAVVDYNEARNEYLMQINENDIIRTRGNMSSRYDEVEKYSIMVRGFSALSAGFWIWNVVDAYIWHSPQAEKKFSISGGSGVRGDTSIIKLTWSF